jgi:hypothetical protein
VGRFDPLHLLLSLTCHRSEDTTDWLLTDKVTSWVGMPSDRGWRYLRQSLERHDGPDTNLRYSKVVFETITGLERASTPPPWLIHRLVVMIPLPCLFFFFRKSYCAWLKKGARSRVAYSCMYALRAPRAGAGAHAIPCTQSTFLT